MRNLMVQKLKKNKVAIAAGSLVLTTASQAAMTAPDFTSNISDLGILLAGMIGFGVLVWGARKLLGFAG